MIEIDIPGTGKRRFHHLVLDVNGTIALDGALIPGVEILLDSLKNRLTLHLVTADTHGTQTQIDRKLGLVAHHIPIENQAEAKLKYIQQLNPLTVVAVGNGANDALMLEHAALGIFIMGPEGGAVQSLLKADVAVHKITDGLELLLNPRRLIATLRR